MIYTRHRGAGALTLTWSFDPGELASQESAFAYTVELIDGMDSNTQTAAAETVEGAARPLPSRAPSS